MFQPKYKHFLLLLCVIAVAFGAVSLAGGATYYRPANPTMDYVPQNVGIYDTYYCENKESDCRVCHGASTAVRHHATQQAREGDCLFCHRDWPYTVPPERDCKVCHIVGGELGDYGFPHHRTDLADSGQCNQCHGNVVVETNTVEPPNVDTSCITPSPYSCENCHWPSGCTEGEAAVYEMNSLNIPVCTSYPVKFKNDWELWTPVNAPRPTNTPVPTPIFIGANGPVISFNNPGGIPDAYDLWHLPQDQAANRWGTIMETKPFRPAGGLHHDGVGLNDAKVYPKCYNCHAPDPGSPSNWDQGNPLLIRFCENCHDTGTLHYGIPEHVTTDNIYRVGGAANQQVKANEKCVACHEGYDPALCPWPEMPEVPAEPFMIARLEPDFGSKGIVVDILPQDGECFIEDPFPGTGLCSFGTKGVGDWVKVGQFDITVPGWVYYDVPIYSWSEHLIQIKVEGYDLSPGNARVRVHKDNPAQTKTVPFSIQQHPTIIGFDSDLDGDTDGADINAAGWGNTIGIVGTGFGTCREKMETIGPPDYGYSSYVELHASNDIYRVKVYPGNWTPTYIKIKLEDLLDTNTGQPVPGASDLYTGCWNLKVITDYFKDDLDGEYMANGLPNGCVNNQTLLTGIPDPDDELLYREISEAKCLNVTKTPVIYCVRPNPVPGGDTATIYGANFGPVKGTSLVKEWNKNHTTSVVPKTTSWANTEIKFKVKPKNPASNKIKDVQVVVNPGAKVSNYYRLTITPPGP